MPSPRPRHGLLATLTAGLLALGLSACSAAPGGGEALDESAGSSGAVETAPDLGAGGGVAEEAAVDREIVTTAHATLVARDPSAAARSLARIAEQAGGRVEQRSEVAATGDAPGSASLVLRIPADRMTSAVEALSGVGEVRDVTVETEDVTTEGRDLDARIAALTTSTDRLRELMGGAASTEDLLAVERELSERQAELDALTAQREHLSDQVEMSTLTVEVTSEPVAAAARQGGFLGGVSSGWEALVATLQGVLLVLGILLPWLAVAALGYLGFRLVRRRLRPATPGAPGAGRPGRGPDDDGPGSGAPSPDAPVRPEREPEPVGR
jgi:glycine cleavage system regulatory protein